MQSKVHPTYKMKYRVANWAAYNQALVRRGDVTVWLSSEAIAAWTPGRSGRRGGQRRYSDLAIETALTLRLLTISRCARPKGSCTPCPSRIRYDSCGLGDMSEPAAFARVVASLYDAMLDDTHWPATSALIDEACGLTGNALLVAEGPPDDIRVLFVGLYYRGQRRLDLEREYLDIYHPINEAIPRQLQLPAGQLVPIPDLYTAEELKTSRTYNEALPRYKNQQGVNVLLDGPGGSRMTWSLADPVASEGWGSSQIAMVRRLMPHVRQFIRVRQALVRAQAGDTTVTALLDNPRIGVLHLDRRGRILAVNDRARSLLRHGEALSDEEGVLQARAPDDQVRLARLVAEALPTSSAVAVSGSMLLARAAGVPPLVVHVKPVGVPSPDYGARPVRLEFPILSLNPGLRHRCVAPGVWPPPTRYAATRR